MIYDQKHITLGRLLNNMRPLDNVNKDCRINEEDIVKILYPDIDPEAILCSYHRYLER